MKPLSNLPPGVTDADIERQACGDEYAIDIRHGADRYGPFLMIDDFRSAMPSVPMARLLSSAPDLVRIVSMLQMWLDAGGQLPSASTLMEDSEHETFQQAIDAAMTKVRGE